MFAALESSTDVFDCDSMDAFQVLSEMCTFIRSSESLPERIHICDAGPATKRNKTMRSPQRRTHCQANEMLGCRMLRRQCAAPSGALIAKKTKCLGNRMQQDNAQPSAAYALPRNRNVGQSDATKTTRSPYALQRNEIPRQSNATRQCAALSGVPIATKTICWAVRCYEDTAQPTAAYALTRKRALRFLPSIWHVCRIIHLSDGYNPNH